MKKKKLIKWILMTMGIIVISVVGFHIFLICSFMRAYFGPPPLSIEQIKTNQEQAAKTKEEKGLIENMGGYFLYATSHELISLNVKDKKISIVKTSNDWNFEAVTAPSQTGKVVYLLGKMDYWGKGFHNMQGFYEYRMCNVNGSEDEALTPVISTAKLGPDTTWSPIPPLGSLAISPNGEMLAVVNLTKEHNIHNHPKDVYFYNYYDSASTGRLEIYRLPSMEKMKEFSWASDRGIAWFPDSSAVAFVGFNSDDYIIKKFNIESEQVTDLCIGENPRIALDGSVLAYWLRRDPSKSSDLKIKFADLKILRLSDMKDTKITEIPDFKERIFALVGVIDSGRLLYVGWTTGLPDKYKMKYQYGAMSIKVGDAIKGTFETISILENMRKVGTFVDAHISYGMVDDNLHK